MRNYKKTNKILLCFSVLFVMVLLFPNITVKAETSESVEWIKNNWLNYPSDIGKWTTSTINGNPALGSTQNVDWSGYLNTFALDTTDSVFEFKMYQNDNSDDDNMGWTFRHNYVNSPTSYKNHSFYVFVTNGGNKNGGNIPSGLYKKSYNTNIAWNPNHGMELLQSFDFGRLQKTLYNVKIDVKDEENGTRIKAWIDGKQVLNYLDTKPLISGGYGPFSFSQANAFYYDMNINGSSVYNIPPTISITNPIQNTSFNPGANINLIGSANDEDNRGTISTYYQFDDGTQQLIWTKNQNGSPISINKNISIPSNIGYGNHTLTIWAKDSENAESKKEVINFFVNDILKPTATHTIVSEKDGTKTIKIIAKDSESGVKRIKLPNGNYVSSSTANINVPNKNSDYLFKIEDNAGNILDYTVTVSDSLVIPNLTAKTTSLNNSISLNWSLNDTWQTYTYNLYRKLQTDTSYSTILSKVSNTSYDDTSAKDLAKPSMPNITNVTANGATSVINISFNKATDYGTTYNHYIEAIGSKNLSKTNSNITTTEVKAGLKGYSIVVDSSPNTIPDNVIETTNTNYQLSKEITGQFYVHISAIDNAGNKSEVQHYLYSDSFSPSMTLTPNTINWTKEDIKIVANANDNETGVKRIKLPNGEYVEGDTATFIVKSNGTYEFTAEDYVGNSFSKTIVVQNIDKTAPTIKITENTTSWTKDDITLTINSSDIGGAGVKEIILPDNSVIKASSTTYTVSANGNYTFKVRDNVGNESVKTISVTKIDRTAPTYTSTEVKNITTDGFDVYIYGVSDNQSGVKFVKFPTWTDLNGQDDLVPNWSLDSNNTVKGEDLGNGTYKYRVNRADHKNEFGNYTVHIYMYDNLGNYTVKGVFYNLKDKTPPTLNITGNPISWTGNNVTLKITASDYGKGIDYILLPNGNRVNNSTSTYTVSANGNYVFKAYDLEGNEIVETIVVTKIDKTPPTINYTKRVQNGIGYIDFNILDNESGIKYLELPDGNRVTSNKYTYSVVNNGFYLFKSVDNVGNQSTISIGFDSITSGNAVSGISRIEYKLSGATTKGWTTYTEPFYITNEGITNITARSYDKAGNVSSEDTSEVKIDKTKPINNGIEIRLK